jgi:aldehyde:ferredoxin oxidoreductase
MEPRRPISQLHDMVLPFIRWLWWLEKMEGSYVSTEAFRNIGKKFWGGAIAADFSTYEGKALAAKKIQDRTYAKESLVLCDLVWPVSCVRDAEDHSGDPSLESQVLSAVTGRDIDEAGLNRIGERIFNLQRAIVTRQGWGGRKGDVLLDYLHNEPLQYVRFNRECIIPGKNGEITNRKGEVVDKEKFEQMKSEHYRLRGWDVETGLPTAATLEKLDLTDIARDLKMEGLIV